MNLEHGDIFRNLILKLAGNLDISQALVNTFAPLRAIVPVDEILLVRLEVVGGRVGEMRAIIRVNENGVVGESDELTLELDSEQRQRLNQQVMVAGTLPSVMIAPTDALMARRRVQILRSMGVPEDSSVLIVLHKNALSAFVIICYRPNAYDENHIRLFEELKEGIQLALSNAIQYQELKKSKESIDDDHRKLLAELRRESTVVGASRGLRGVMMMVQQVAPNQTPVLLLGETGAGKEVIAQAIHRASGHAGGPMISVNCGAIPESLIDSELFGHEKGAFTGAVSTSRGRFERANGGTLFLDEVGELPLSAQIRLLRVLQTKEFERVGGTQVVRVNVRVIAATHRNLEEMVVQGRFREDLWFRLNVFPISIPPLRDHKEDIPMLAYHFIENVSREMNLRNRPAILDGEMKKLIAYDWPGNIRELQNAIERAIILSPNGPLNFFFLSDARGATPDDRGAGATSLPADRSYPTFDDSSRAYLIRTLDQASGWIAGPGGAAELAGLNPSTFRAKMKKLGVKNPHARPRARRSP